MQGCGWQMLLIPLVFLLTYWGNDAPAANPDAMMNPLVVVGIVVGGLWFLSQMLKGGGGMLMLIIVGIAAALIFLNGTDAMPTLDNPCPGDEVIIAIGGGCYGMDADANRQWADEMLGGGQP